MSPTSLQHYFSLFNLSVLSDPMDRSSPGLPVLHQLPEFTQTHVHRVGDAIQPPHPLSSPSPPIFNLSQHRGLFQGVSSSNRWSKYRSFRFSISPSRACLGLISLKMDWFDLLAVQGTLKSLMFTGLKYFLLITGQLSHVLWLSDWRTLVLIRNSRL